MKNERGFFTIVGLCLLLTVAISIMGVQEFETNYSHGAENALLEAELKNAAESALIEAIKDPNLKSKTFGEITVQIERRQPVEGVENIHFEKDKYVTKALDLKSKSGTIFIAVASCDSKFMEGKIYRRALAFVLEDDPNQTIHFVNDL